MSGYIEAGYLVALGTLGTYAVSLVTRERAARHRIPPAPAEPGSDPSGEPERTGGSS